jgi:Low-density lipoprotein receptor domain class A
VKTSLMRAGRKPDAEYARPGSMTLRARRWDGRGGAELLVFCMLSCSKTDAPDLGVSHGNSPTDAGGVSSSVGTSVSSTSAVSAQPSASLVPEPGVLASLPDAGVTASAASAAPDISSEASSAPQTSALPYAPSASATTFLVVPPGVSDAVAAGLQPLWTPSASIEQATGSELIELALDVGLARGLANCLCNGSQAKTPEFFNSCAPAETWLYFSVDAATQKKCLAEGLNEVPGVDDLLRCESYQSQKSGFYELGQCLGEDAAREAAARPAVECEPLPAAREFVQFCSHLVHYCADGTRVKGYRCDAQVDCEDSSDEFNCFEVDGHDIVDCGDYLIQNRALCLLALGPCLLADGTSVCNFETPQFRCKDGVEIPTDLVCDRKEDCADGTDEQLCLR